MIGIAEMVDRFRGNFARSVARLRKKREVPSPAPRLLPFDERVALNQDSADPLNDFLSEVDAALEHSLPAPSIKPAPSGQQEKPRATEAAVESVTALSSTADPSAKTGVDEPRRMTQPSISLAQILGRAVIVQWHEAAAVVQQVCRFLAQHPAKGHEVGLKQVHIHSTGEVRVVASGETRESPIKQLGRILNSLLSNVPAPAELRLVISQATFEVPLYGNIDEFSQALGYFERPGRTEIVKALYERACDAPENETESKPVPEASDKNEASATFSRPRRYRPAFLLFGVAASLVLFLVVLGSRHGTRGWSSITNVVDSGISRLAGFLGVSSVNEGSAVKSSAAPAAKSVTDLRRSGLSTRRSADAAKHLQITTAPITSTSSPGAPNMEKNNLGRGHALPGVYTNRDTDVSPPVALRQNSPILSRRGAPLRIVTSSDGANQSNGESRSKPNQKPIEVNPQVPGHLAAPATERSENHNSSEGVGSRLPEMGVEGDADVRPPAWVRPALPSTPPQHVPLEELGVLELLISETGIVESVKLRSKFNRYQDRMIVSAAKAWRYWPALKNGVPVKFRMSVQITT